MIKILFLLLPLSHMPKVSNNYFLVKRISMIKAHHHAEAISESCSVYVR